MHITSETFWLPKSGNAADEYEDAAWPAVSVSDDCTAFRAAVSDGATEASFSALWAKLLVEAYKDGLLEGEAFSANVADLQRLWVSKVGSLSLPWYAEQKLESGAFAALVGLTISDLQDGTVGDWSAMAIGDSCMFHISGGELVASMPILKAEEFNSRPTLMCSRHQNNVGYMDQIRVRSGTYAPGDLFFLMSDALASWFLKNWELKSDPLDFLEAIGNDDDFKQFIAVSHQVTTKLDKLLRSYNATIESLNNERSSLALREKQEATAIDERTNKELARLAKQRVEIDRAENDEVIRLGKDMAENYVLYALQNAHISSARIDGFGVKMKARLAAYGVTSAADIDNRVFRIPGIKSGKASSLFTWRGWIEQQARMEAPSPAPSAVSHVKMKYEAARTTNMQQTMAVRTRENDDRQLLMRNFGRYHAENARRTTEAEQTYEASRRRIVTDGDHTKADLKKQFEILSKRLQGERERYNQELTNLNQKLFRAKLEVTSAQRAVDRIGFVSFSSYVKATFRLKRSA